MKKNFTLKDKLGKGMKICSLQVAIAVTIGTMAFAHDDFAQLLDKKITISIKEMPIDEALDAIGAAAGVKFFYSVDQLNVKDKLTLNAVNRSLKQILEDLLLPYHVKYKVHERKGEITLKRQEQDARSELDLGSTDERIASVSSTIAVTTITGTVTDAATGQPMAGVNIIVKGTTDGTATDAEGKFSIWATDKDVLVFSFIGYKPFEMQVGNRLQLDVAMEEDVTDLKEVEINAGYYKTSRELQTGSIVRIDASQIEKQPVSNLLATLQSNVPGLEITQQNGVPGGNFRVRIRGTNSLSAGNDPLYIVDGVPYTSTAMSFRETAAGILGGVEDGSSPLNSINPSDIESIEVLKDADATAIYGSRGANGVILITTRKGTSGKTNVGVNFYSGISQLSHRLNLLNTAEYITMRKEAFKNDGLIPTPSSAQDLTVWDTTRYTDWQKELIGGSARVTDGELSIAGGDKLTQFLVSGGFHKETMVFPGDNHDQRVSLLTSITNTSSNQKFRTALSLSLSRNQTDIASKDLAYAAALLPPNAPALYDETGELNWEGWSASLENPMALLKRRYEAATHNLIGNATLGYEILTGLQAGANLGFTSIQSKAVTTYPISSLDPAQVDRINKSVFGEKRFENWIVEPELSWKSALGEGAISILFGATFLDQVTEGLAQYANDFTSEALMKNLGTALTINSATNIYSQYKYQAFFGRANYVLKDRYVINLTGRRDGSSRFGPGKQYAVFGAIGSAWIFSKEDFIKNSIPFMSFGKLRASYGTTGNDQIGDYQYLDSYRSSGRYQDEIGLSPARLYNPDFAWEINRKLDVSAELGFINDRISVGASFYRNRSSNQLVGFPLGATTGFSNIQGNFPAVVQNSGVELSLTTRNIQSNGQFQWSTYFNLTIPKNRLVEFADIETSPDYDNLYVVGKPLDIAKAYKYTGMDPVSGEYQFEDVNKDEVYNLDDRTIIKFLGRELYGGLRNTFRYEGLELDVSLQFVKQQGYDYRHSFYSAPGAPFNQLDLVMQRWIPSNPNANIQRFTTVGTAASEAYSNYFYNSDASITDASFIRVKNVSLSYSISSILTERLSIESAIFFIQGQNLLTATDYVGLDPEVRTSAALPPLRTLSVGLKVKI